MPVRPRDATGDSVEVTQLIAVRIALDTENLDLVPGMNVQVTMCRS